MSKLVEIAYRFSQELYKRGAPTVSAVDRRRLRRTWATWFTEYAQEKDFRNFDEEIFEVTDAELEKNLYLLDQFLTWDPIVICVAELLRAEIENRKRNNIWTRT